MADLRPQDDSPFGTHAPGPIQSLLIGLGKMPPFNRGWLRYKLAGTILGMGARVVDISFRNCSYRVYDDRHPIEYGMLLYPGYNGDEIDFLLAGISPGGTVIDLGANIGMYTLPMAQKAGSSGKALAIDASAAFLKKLKFNAAASGLDNVAIENVAVGDREGTVRLERIEKNPGTAEVSEDADGGIRMRTLLSILEDHGVQSVDAMKVDIDGFEDKALVPFFTAAPDALLPRRVVIEHLMMDGGRDTCLGAMDSRGYALVGKTRSNSLYELKLNESASGE